MPFFENNNKIKYENNIIKENKEIDLPKNDYERIRRIVSGEIENRNVENINENKNKNKNKLSIN